MRNDLHLTIQLITVDPNGWSAAAMYQATRIFASNLKEKMAQRFFNLVLLPRIRDDIAEFKKLNFHLYQALRKALFKPAAFMKGFLIPLCEVFSAFLFLCGFCGYIFICNVYINFSNFLIGICLEWNVYSKRSYYNRICPSEELDTPSAFIGCNVEDRRNGLFRIKFDISESIYRQEIRVALSCH